MTLRLSFRTRILLVVLVLAVFPLGLTGLWLTRTAPRSGEALLQARLEQYLADVVTRVGTSWLRERSDILFLAEDSGVQRALDGGITSGGVVPASLVQRFDALGGRVSRATVRTLDASRLWTLEAEPDAPGASATQGSLLVVELPIHRRFPAARLGDLEVHLRVGSLLGEAGAVPTVGGAVLALFDRERGTPLLPLPFDADRLDESRFAWGGDDWLAVERTMTEPPLRLVAAAPLTPFVEPFESAARDGAWWLAVVAIAGVLGAAMVTARLTRRLDRLATAAGAVAGGELDVQLDEAGDDEVGRVARAFNVMTGSLRRTMNELSARERLAAVGEFAASLAHEVRNPLTAIRLDLQQVEESLPPDSRLKATQARALAEIARLDATVGEALDLAKARRPPTAVADLRAPIEAAVAAARPAFDTREATLTCAIAGTGPIGVPGDPKAIEQLFLNLLLNAAAALGPHGRAWLEVEPDGDHVTVIVRDAGTGIPEDVLPRVFEPLFSTRSEGTGLGLTVARRIVGAHHGTIAIESRPGAGTSVRVRLPLAPLPV